MKQVKGSMIKLVVKAMRVDKSGIYDKILSDNAKELYTQHVLDPVWYPFDAYKECFNALCQVDGKNDSRIILQWGRARGEELMTTIYRHSITDVNLKTALYSYSRFHRTVFNFGEVVGKIVSDHEMIVSYKDFEPGWKNFMYIATGWVSRFFELCIDKKITCKVTKYSTEANNSTDILLTWN